MRFSLSHLHFQRLNETKQAAHSTVAKNSESKKVTVKTPEVMSERKKSADGTSSSESRKMASGVAKSENDSAETWKEQPLKTSSANIEEKRKANNLLDSTVKKKPSKSIVLVRLITWLLLVKLMS